VVGRYAMYNNDMDLAKSLVERKIAKIIFTKKNRFDNKISHFLA